MAHVGRVLLALALLAPAQAPRSVHAEARIDGESEWLPDARKFEDAMPEGATLSGREIYRSFLDNRYRKSLQRMKVISKDPGGSSQTTVFTARLQDFRDEQDRAVNGIKAKMLIEITQPFDVRHTAYLMIFKDPGPDDQFIYQPSQRRVRRVDLGSTPLMGTDYTFDDIVYHDLESATYKRLPDEVIEATPVYVVESDIEDTHTTEFHRTISYLEKEHYVPLRVRYWDDHDVEVKVLSAPHSKIRAFGDAWVSTESTMRDLLQRTESVLLIDDMQTDPEFPADLFETSRLGRGH
jgi:hypothetical protein